MNRGREIMLVVGEASGDMHGASLVKALLKRDPNLTFFGVAGDQLQRTSFETLFTVSKLTGMGLLELAGNIKNIIAAYRLCAGRCGRTQTEPSHPHRLPGIQFATGQAR